MTADDATTPLPDYDQLTVGTIQHRCRSLDQDQMERLIAHERDAANRPQVLQILTARLGELRAGAEPSGGDPSAAPEVSDTPRQSNVGPEHSPTDHTPLRHGVTYQTPARGKP
ncbi:hypothetical protein HQ308_08495 [Rhodococcus sp. BP-241]|uniref:hypothetical protein n=1 Tax=Rhodococcus sp. BP-241 TaxID=2739441 RepID=UPI001C9B1046|nr:hypothetical protein [Rhodococcus sp. BP-241]MBY6706841.1 hypothetical protein [Rhodococcus sp. BP-241]